MTDPDSNVTSSLGETPMSDEQSKLKKLIARIQEEHDVLASRVRTPNAIDRENNRCRELIEETCLFRSFLRGVISDLNELSTDESDAPAAEERKGRVDQ